MTVLNETEFLQRVGFKSKKAVTPYFKISGSDACTVENANEVKRLKQIKEEKKFKTMKQLEEYEKSQKALATVKNQAISKQEDKFPSEKVEIKADMDITPIPENNKEENNTEEEEKKSTLSQDQENTVNKNSDFTDISQQQAIESIYEVINMAKETAKNVSHIYQTVYEQQLKQQLAEITYQNGSLRDRQEQTAKFVEIIDAEIAEIEGQQQSQLPNEEIKGLFTSGGDD